MKPDRLLPIFAILGAILGLFFAALINAVIQSKTAPPDRREQFTPNSKTPPERAGTNPIQKGSAD